ncbi:MAG: DUF3365 domain-containing protein [Arcobacteraceae bacterium]|nr:DUF3365 domain-containing protein [Arcobacteraceae bacterium]
MNKLFHIKLKKLNKYYINVLIILTIVIAFSLGWNIYNESTHHKNAALEHARNSFVKDLMFRKWVASHGGVYVFPTEKTSPNQYLAHIPDRDLITTTGKKLTLMNPAYTLRQLMEDYEGMYGAKGHITSLKLLNPRNKPNDWEIKALKLFDSGKQKEFHEFLSKDGKKYIYYMKALVTRESCLKCHKQQGYKVGDIRGGVSITIPMKKYNDDMYSAIYKIVLAHLVFYIIAILGLFYTYKNLKISLIEQEKLYEENRRKEEVMLAQSRHAAMGEMISMIAHQWRQPIAIIAMWANNITADIDMDEIDDENFKKYAFNIVTQTEHLSQTIDDFRNFFRPDKKREKVLIKDVMEECLSVIGKSLENNNIEIEKNYQSDNIAKIHSRELMQVYINIIKNAKEAVIERNIKDKKIIIDIYEDKNHIITTIKDNALGIDEGIMQKIFDPYFTTKNVKIGTGLGLYMSKTIVEKHLNGTISVKNTEDGACFTVILPKDKK